MTAFSFHRARTGLSSPPPPSSARSPLFLLLLHRQPRLLPLAFAALLSSLSLLWPPHTFQPTSPRYAPRKIECALDRIENPPKREVSPVSASGKPSAKDRPEITRNPRIRLIRDSRPSPLRVPDSVEERKTRRKQSLGLECGVRPRRRSRDAASAFPAKCEAE